MAATVDHLHQSLFQFTPLREGRPFQVDTSAIIRIFQFTPLREGRRSFWKVCHKEHYFNSRPCERGDSGFHLCAVFVGISIHAPARGATHVYGTTEAISRISIHAPARGATSSWRRRRRMIKIISIHAPARGATKVTGTTTLTWEISIHAPARGATGSKNHLRA